MTAPGTKLVRLVCEHERWMQPFTVWVQPADVIQITEDYYGFAPGTPTAWLRLRQYSQDSTPLLVRESADSLARRINAALPPRKTAAKRTGGRR